MASTSTVIEYPSPAKLKRLRLAAGFPTYESLAQSLRISGKSIEYYEKGLRRMSNVVVIYRFAATVGVGVEELLDGGD